MEQHFKRYFDIANSHYQYFLDFFFVDNILKFKKLNLLSLNNLKESSLVLKKNNLFSLKIPLNFFDEINELSIFNNLVIKEVFITLNFSIENPIFSKLSNSKSFFKNLPYLWVFN